MVAVRNRLLMCVLLALALFVSAGAGSARAATVVQSGTQITITFGNSGAIAETVYMYTFGTNWTFTGDSGGAGPIAIASACEIVVNDVGGGSNQELVLGPSTILTPSACGSNPFKLTTTGLDRLSLSGNVNMPSTAGSSISVDAATTITADFEANINGPIAFQSTLKGSHALALTGTAVTLGGRVGETYPPTSVSTTASTATTLGASITTTGSQTYNGAVTLSSSLTLAASALTLGATNADPIANGSGSPVTLTTDVSGTSSIAGVLGKTGGTTAEKAISLVKEGAGRLTLPASNTYTGTTTVNGGTLDCANAFSLGSATDGTTVASGARLQFRLGANNAEPITLAGGSTLAASTPFAENLSGPIVLQSGAQTFDVATGGTLNLTGGVNGQSAGRGAVTATGAGRVAILTAGMGVTNAVASFTSSASGALRIGGNITATGAVTLDGGVETWANAVTVTGAPVSGSGTIDNGNGSSFSTLTLDSGTEPSTLSGAIGSAAGDVSKLNLVLAGTSAHTLSGTSGFTGSLTVQAGALIVSGELTHPSSTTLAATASVSAVGTGVIGSPVSFAAGSQGYGIGSGFPYRLTTGTVTSSPTSGYLNVVVNGLTPGSGYTQIMSTGSVNLSNFDVWSTGFEAPLGTVITPISTASGITGTLTGHPEGSYYNYWRISYAANGGKDMTWTYVGMAPQPTAVSPSTSSTAGGGTLTITGGPLYDGTQVTVGGVPCTNPNRVSITELTCTLPPHAAGVVDVVVTNTDRSATLTGAVTYTAPAVAPATAATTRALAIGTPRLVGTKLVTTITAPSAGAILQTAVTRKGRKATTRCRVRQSVTAAGDLTITCSLNKRARAALRRAKLRLTVTTTFTPTGGTATTRVAKVTAKRIVKGKRALQP